MIDIAEITELSLLFENKPPQEVVSWAVNTFNKDIAFACSFGMEDLCIVDMIVKAGSEASIFYLDTSLLFKETYELIRKLEDRYRIKFESVRTECTLEQQADRHGDDLWTVDPDLCCNIRKVAPLKKKLSALKAWMTGIRREQTPERADAKAVEWDKKFELVKINPIIKWTSADTKDYIMKYGIPYNPLHDKGYPSIGCKPCTFPVKPGEDPRSGRWKGFAKKECGLHK